MTGFVPQLRDRAAGVKMPGMIERATWPLRRLGWWIEENVLWPLADALRAVLRADVRIALGVAAVAAGVGVAIAAFGGGLGDAEQNAPAANPPRVAAQPAPITPGAKPEAEAKGPPTLQGVQPDFKSASQGERSQSTAGSKATSPLAGTNSKPSQIPAAAANDATALRAAKQFAGAFVLYEVGKTNPKVKRTIARTATPALARALRERPPRLPASVKVPVAKVKNIVLGARRGRELGASVSLLRLGDLSELRLTLTRRHGAWAVSEVRG
jgi:hypothetical protein